MRFNVDLLHRLSLGALAWTALLGNPASAQAPAQRFDCKLNGDTYRLTEDLGLRHPNGLWRCNRLDGVELWPLPQQLDPPRPWRHTQYLLSDRRSPPRADGSSSDHVAPHLHALLEQVSLQVGLPLPLLHAVVNAESGYRIHARSHRGALGLMQLMPRTAQAYGVQTEEALLDPLTNLQVGAIHLRDLLARYRGRLDLALAAYNAGPEAVRRAGNAVPDIRETRHYVDRILFQLGS